MRPRPNIIRAAKRFFSSAAESKSINIAVNNPTDTAFTFGMVGLFAGYQLQNGREAYWQQRNRYLKEEGSKLQTRITNIEYKTKTSKP